MSESYILLQIDDGNNEELMDDGYYFKAKNKGYYAEFFSDGNEAFRECAKAEYFSSMSVRQQLPEESINQLMINALVTHLKLRKSDVDYLVSTANRSVPLSAIKSVPPITPIYYNYLLF